MHLASHARVKNRPMQNKIHVNGKRPEAVFCFEFLARASAGVVVTRLLAAAAAEFNSNG
jgi:hypothetical protein